MSKEQIEVFLQIIKDREDEIQHWKDKWQSCNTERQHNSMDLIYFKTYCKKFKPGLLAKIDEMIAQGVAQYNSGKGQKV